MSEQVSSKDLRITLGLCADCAYAREVRSARGSTFYLCQLSASDPRYPKYPRLPVLACFGYKKKVKAQVGQTKEERSD